MVYHWDTKIRYVRGLGPTRSRELTKIGIETVGDLLEYPPLSYIFPGVTPIAEAKDGMVVIRAKIVMFKWAGYDNSVQLVAELDDGTGVCKAEWYNTRAPMQSLRSGMTATFYGKLKGGVLQQPKWTTVPEGMNQVCGGQYGVHHSTVRAALVEVLANVELPDMILGAGRKYTFEAFHFPSDKAEQQMALRALKFDEALTLQLALAERRRGREQCVGVRIEI